MAYAMINLKYGTTDDWQEIKINSISDTLETNTLIQKNAIGTESYLQIGSPIQKLSTSSSLTINTDVWKIQHYLIATGYEAEIDIEGYGIRLARVIPSHTGSVENTSDYLTPSYKITLID